MIIVDAALERREKEGNPVRVGLVGAGYMGRGTAVQIFSAFKGLRLVAISNRTLSEAERAYRDVGVDSVTRVESVAGLKKAIDSDQFAVTDDGMLLAQTEEIDVIIEATGDVEFGAHIALKAFEHGIHVVLMNAELDATIGPLLKVYADGAGVVVSNADGDQPGVIMNLLRYVRTIGCNPVLAGNMKGLQDPYRTPKTQEGFAKEHGQKPRLVTSFADGTKICMEMAVVANATGFRAAKRGMYGHECKHVNDSLELYSVDELLQGGLVDYVLGAQPGGGVFVLGYNDHPIQQPYMRYYKMGDGPLYCFYTPYHLPHIEVPITAARVALFHDAATAPLGAPICDVLTVAKRDLKAGEVLDGIGCFMTYGTIDNYEVCQEERLLPMGLAEGCCMKRDVARDSPITYDDVEVPPGRLADKLRAEQHEHFFAKAR